MDNKKVYAPFLLADYRVVRPAAFLEENSNTVAFTQRLTEFQVNGCAISFITPNAVAMLLNKSLKEYNSGVQIYNTLIRPHLTKEKIYDIKQEDHTVLYDYLEHMQTSIISMYSAIEALCNVAIPESFTLTKKNNKGIKEIWTKADIEKWTPTEEKAGKIVPEILGAKTPKEQPFWKDFQNLKHTRDNIIHQKQSRTAPNEVESGFWATLLDVSIFKAIEAGFLLMKYFCELDENHAFFPILTPEIKVFVTKVDSFETVLSSTGRGMPAPIMRGGGQGDK